MKLLKRIGIFIGIIVFLQTGYAVPESNNDFDYYVLVLSWSPEFCSNSQKTNEEQCKIGRKYDFVLHGLWPQHEKGYPSECSTQKIPRKIEKKCNIFPSKKLCYHEWKKHGTCSGLNAAGYLDLSKSLKESVVIPNKYKLPEKPFKTTLDELKSEFIAANPGFSNNSIAPYCKKGNYLKEVFFCYNKNGKPRSCSKEVLKKSAKSCGKKDGFIIRNVR